MKVLGSAHSSRRKGGYMVLIRLEHHEHPAPPQHEMRQKSVLDSQDEIVGAVANLYVDDDRVVHFIDVSTSGFFGSGTKHHLVPVEAVSEEDSGSITLRVEREAVASAPPFPDPHVGPDEEYQRTIREHYGYA
jgi:hypothetical protein